MKINKVIFTYIIYILHCVPLLNNVFFLRIRFRFYSVMAVQWGLRTSYIFELVCKFSDIFFTLHDVNNLTCIWIVVQAGSGSESNSILWYDGKRFSYQSTTAADVYFNFQHYSFTVSSRTSTSIYEEIDASGGGESVLSRA